VCSTSPPPPGIHWTGRGWGPSGILAGVGINPHPSSSYPVTVLTELPSGLNQTTRFHLVLSLRMHGGIFIHLQDVILAYGDNSLCS
jgi:hypothetical protein